MQVIQSLTVFALQSWLTTIFVVGGLGIEDQQNGLCKVLVWLQCDSKDEFSWNSRVEILLV